MMIQPAGYRFFELVPIENKKGHELVSIRSRQGGTGWKLTVMAGNIHDLNLMTGGFNKALQIFL